MAFAHFHKHYRKYMFFFLVATLFSLLAFNITTALTSFMAGLFGGGGGKYFVFKTVNGGKEIGVEQADFAATEADLPGALRAYYQVTFSNPYPNLFDPNSRRRSRGSVRDMIPNAVDLAAAHTMLLAEAHTYGIEVPPEQVEKLYDRLHHQIHDALAGKDEKYEPTEDDWHRVLRFEYRLNEEMLRQRFAELYVVDAYVRSVVPFDVPDPTRLDQLFAQQCTKVGLQYVAVPFATCAEELRKSPPADAELETYFKGLSENAIDADYTNSACYTVDLVVVDADAWDPASVPAAVEFKPAEPTDDEMLAECKRDPKRYTADGKAPAVAADLTADERGKVKKDRTLDALFGKLRADFDAAVAALPPLSLDEPKKGEDGKPDAAAVEKQKAALADRVAKEKQLFAETVAKYGLSVQSLPEQAKEKLAEVDPPKDSRLENAVNVLSAPGKPGLRTVQEKPLGAVKYGFLVRLADAPKPQEKMTFEQAKSKLLDAWIAEHAQTAASDKAAAFRKALLEDAEKKVDAARLEMVRKHRDAELAKADPVKDDAELKKAKQEKAARDYFEDVESAVGSAFGARFGELAKGVGLEPKDLAPQRRNVSSTPHFHDLFAGAERFLLQQNRFDEYGTGVLGFDVGAVSEVLVDAEDKAALVAVVTSRETPKPDEMRPVDRTLVERLEQEERPDRDPTMAMIRSLTGRGGPEVKRPPYEDPFSMGQILRRHEPRIRTRDESETSGAGRNPYGGS